MKELDLGMSQSSFPALTVLLFCELWLPAGCLGVSKAFPLDGEEEVGIHTQNLGEQIRAAEREKQ